MMPVWNWKFALWRLAIHFEYRFLDIKKLGLHRIRNASILNYAATFSVLFFTLGICFDVHHARGTSTLSTLVFQ